MDTPAYILRHFLWWRFSRVFDRFLNDFHIFRFGFYPHFKYLLWWIDFILFRFVGSGISFKYCYIFYFCLLLFYWDGQFQPSNFSRTVELHFSSVLWPMENKWLKFSSKYQLRTIDKMKQYKSTTKKSINSITIDDNKKNCINLCIGLDCQTQTQITLNILWYFEINEKRN